MPDSTNLSEKAGSTDNIDQTVATMQVLSDGQVAWKENGKLGVHVEHSRTPILLLVRLYIIRLRKGPPQSRPIFTPSDVRTPNIFSCFLH
jgi:hypothetical protein